MNVEHHTAESLMSCLLLSGMGRRVGIFNLISIFHFLLTGHGAAKKEKRRQEGSKKGRGDLKRACLLKPILFIKCYVLKNFVQVRRLSKNLQSV